MNRIPPLIAFCLLTLTPALAQTDAAQDETTYVRQLDDGWDVHRTFRFQQPPPSVDVWVPDGVVEPTATLETSQESRRVPLSETAASVRDETGQRLWRVHFDNATAGMRLSIAYQVPGEDVLLRAADATRVELFLNLRGGNDARADADVLARLQVHQVPEEGVVYATAAAAPLLLAPGQEVTLGAEPRVEDLRTEGGLLGFAVGALAGVGLALLWQHRRTRDA